LDRGLPNFFNDFRNSMYAAWTPAELAAAVPCSPRRAWHQITQRGLPTVQLLLGAPRNTEQLLPRKDLPWHDSNHPVPKTMASDWNLFRFTLLAPGSATTIASSKQCK
jgi:hypothetical protein